MTSFPADLTPGSGNSDNDNYILGMLVTPSVDVSATGVSYYSPEAQTGTSVVIYGIGVSGTPLAKKLINFTAAAWNTGEFDTPLTLTAGQQYLVGVHLPSPAKYTALSAGVTQPLTEGALTSSDLSVFRNGVTNTTLGAPPHVGSPSDGGDFDAVGVSWYGLRLEIETLPLEAIAFTATRNSDTHCTLAWADPGDAPDGLSVLRATGSYTVDGNDVAFGEDGYDPTTIPGATIIADNAASPYVDTTLVVSDTYTYAVIRTGPDAP